MTTKLMPVKMGDGSLLYIQSIMVNQGGEVLAGSNDVVKAADCIDKALPAVTEFCEKTKERIIEQLKPDEIKLEFSVSFTGDMNAIIASASAEAGITVELVWKKEEK